MNKKILIVGCGVSQIPTIKEARKLNVDTVGVDFNENAIGVQYVDIFEKVDIKDHEAVLKIAQKYKV